MIKLRNCPDCSVEPGKPHEPYCDVQRCSVCGGQRISCDCLGEEKMKLHDKLFSRWTGFWPGEIESEFLGIDLNQFYIQGYEKIFFVKPMLSE